MSPAIVDQLVLWALTGAVGLLCTIVMLIGRHIIAKMEATQQDIVVFRAENSQKFADLKDEIQRDFGHVRERLARVEGAVFPERRSNNS